MQAQSWRRVFALLLLLVQIAGSLPLASAQTSEPPADNPDQVAVGSGDVLVTGNETWNASRNVSGILLVRGNASLTITGATVRVGFLGVERGGRLVLESTPDASVTLASSNATGWEGVIAGTFVARGLPDKPVVIDGVGGTASRSKGNFLFKGGFYLSANGTVQHLVFTNYTSGMYVSHGGNLSADGIRFASGKGVGLLASDGIVNATHAEFVGSGASVLASSRALMTLSGATFDSPKTGIVTSASKGRYSNISVANADFCIEVEGGNSTIQGLECHNFQRFGVRATLQQPSTRTILRLQDANISDSNATPGEGHGVYLGGLTEASVVNVTIGPVQGNGLIDIATKATIQGVVIHDAGIYGEVLVDPPNGVTDAPHFTGSGGRQGMLEVKRTVQPDVLLSNGTRAFNASVAYYTDTTRDPFAAQTVNGPDTGTGGDPPSMVAVIVFPNGTRGSFNYTAIAKSEDQKEEARVVFAPDGKPFVIHLQPVVAAKPASGLGLPLIALAVVFAAVAWRQTRRR
jgi:hypothetical protein